MACTQQECAELFAMQAYLQALQALAQAELTEAQANLTDIENLLELNLMQIEECECEQQQPPESLVATDAAKRQIGMVLKLSSMMRKRKA